jgi:hypothetical protein
MSTQKNIPPKIALALLEKCLPNSVKDEIIGDLHEQYFYSNEPLVLKQLSFWWQAMLVISRYVILSKKLIAVIISAISCAIFFVCISALLFLSNSNDAQAFSKPYWTDGNFYQFFIDPMLYQFMSTKMLEGINLQLFINLPSVLWSLGGVVFFVMLKRRSLLNLQTIAMASLILLIGPYFWGVMSFKTNEIPLQESGPIIAFSLVTVIYLIVPLTFLFVKQMLSRTHKT